MLQLRQRLSEPAIAFSGRRVSVTAAPLAPVRRMRARRLRWRLAASALLHAVLVLGAILFAAPPADDRLAVSPPSFDLVFAPTQPAETAPPAPSEPAAPPAPPAPPEVRIAAPPRLPLTTLPDPDADLPPGFLDAPTPPEPAPQPPPEPAAPARTALAQAGAGAHGHGNGGFNLTLSPAALQGLGSAIHDPASTEDMIRVRGGHVADGWLKRMHEWWAEHGYYPEQALRRQQDGTVVLHFLLDRAGHVRGVQLVSSSGSQWLDAGAQAIFRGQTLPAPETPDAEDDIEVTIDYVLER